MGALGGAMEGEVDPAVSDHMSRMAQRRWTAGKAKQAIHEAMTGGEPHPLFPTEPGEPIPQIEWINIARFEKGGTVDCLRVFPAGELTTLDDLANMYGGGSYELRGRCSGSSGQPGPMVRRARYKIDGRSLPFTGEDDGGQQDPGQLPAAAGALGPSAMDPMVMFMTMMKESQAEARAAGERQTAMLVAMMTQSGQQQSATMSAMATIMASAMNAGSKGPDVGSLLTAVSGMSSAQVQAFASMVPRPDTSDPIEKIAKLMEVAKAMKGDEDSLSALMGGFGQAAAGIAEIERAGAAAKQAEAQKAQADAMAAHAAAQQQQQQPEPQQQPAPQQPQNGAAPASQVRFNGRGRNEAESLG
jgi:hypothetical protein